LNVQEPQEDCQPECRNPLKTCLSLPIGRAKLAARETRADGTVCHGSTDSADSLAQAFIESFAEAPPKVLVGTPRGSTTKNQLDQALLFQYFTWAGQAFDVGVAFAVDNHQVEFWFIMTLQPLPDDERLSVYVRAIQEFWFERLQETAPQLAAQIQTAGVTNSRFETR
jgi:hypothetical protein